MLTELHEAVKAGFFVVGIAVVTIVILFVMFMPLYCSTGTLFTILSMLWALFIAGIVSHYTM